MGKKLMESIENKILTALKKCGRGKVFFKQDFSRYSNPKKPFFFTNCQEQLDTKITVYLQKM